MLQGEQGDDGKVEGPSGPPGDRVNIIVNAFRLTLATQKATLFARWHWSNASL